MQILPNKTQRKQISTHAMRLKDVELHDVKKYLIKHDLIKGGTTAPPDVLRKMYEAIALTGNVVNHNPENTLFNYVQGSKN